MFGVDVLNELAHQARLAGGGLTHDQAALRTIRFGPLVQLLQVPKARPTRRVTLQLTFLEANVHELADMVRLAIDLGVDRVKGHHLWTHFEEIAGQSMRRNLAAIQRWNQAVRDAYQASGERLLPNGKAIQMENIFPLDGDAIEDLAPGGTCPFLGQEAWVSAEGRFDPCCAPDAQRRTLGEFGNLGNLGIMEIWNGDAYRELKATYRNRRLCMGCNMRKPAGDKK